ncbi:MAG: hypothetical protein Q9213_007526 [Squamulea squamosa]
MSRSAEATLVAEGKESFLKRLREITASGGLEDLTISCGELQWKVHRIVVYSHSDWFRKACQPGFKEGKTALINLENENPALIAKLVEYLYGFDYDDSDSEPNEVDQTDDKNNNDDDQDQPVPQTCGKLALHAAMYVTADKYDVSTLKVLALAKFSTALVDRWDKEDLSEVIRFVYENTVSSDRGLRGSLVPILVQHKQKLRTDEAFMKLVETHGEFAVDLINAWTNPNQQDAQRSFLQCRHCETLRPGNYNGTCCMGQYYSNNFRTLYLAT